MQGPASGKVCTLTRLICAHIQTGTRECFGAKGVDVAKKNESVLKVN